MANNESTTWAIKFSDAFRVALKSLLEVRSFLFGEHFYCSALHGESEYNISINSDMSVSCNCQDRGEGTLGYLNQTSFKDVFFGEKANDFREVLAKGKLPIDTCARCSELKRLKRNESPPPMRLPYRGLMLENTIGCNLDCPGCIRKEVVVNRKAMSLSLDKLEGISVQLAELGLQKLFYLNRGEPFMSSRIKEELQLIRQEVPSLHICTSTNGTLLSTESKRDAALLMDEVEFSIDGCDQDSLEKYQKGGSFERSYKNMKALVEYRNSNGLAKPIIEWKYLLFSWNDKPEQIESAIKQAKEAGVDLISFWPTNSPFYGISWRYHFGQFNKLGKKSWKGREVWFSADSNEYEPQINADSRPLNLKT